MVGEHRAYLFTRVINFQHILTSTKALIDDSNVCVTMISIVHPHVVKMIICFGWKFHEILLNTVYLRKLCDVDAVDVRVLHNVSYCGAQTSFRMSYVSAFLKCVRCKLFWTKIVLCYNCTVNFYFNLFRNRNLDLTMDLF